MHTHRTGGCVPDAPQHSLQRVFGGKAFVIDPPPFLALPYSHLYWGDDYPGDGQKAMGFFVIFLGIGVVVAALYFIIASLLHFFRRARAWTSLMIADAVLGACFAGLLTFAGVSIRYSDAHAMPGTPISTPASSRFR